MPKHHLPPPVADTPARGRLKKPKAIGPHRAHHKTAYLQPQLPNWQDIEPPTRPQASNPPENLSAPALSLPRVHPSETPGDTLPTTDEGRTPTAPTGTVGDRPERLMRGSQAGPQAEEGVTGVVAGTGGVEFHHASEAEFASLLTYYGIEWQYEPHAFPLQWRDGRPTEMFAPDFYLPEYDLYIELTTMRQSLVRRKNRKLRLLRALYPEINIKLLYRRDYQRLLERFGFAPPGPDDVESTEESPGD